MSKSRGIQNLNGQENISFIPSEAIIDAKKEIEIKIQFKPDRVSDKYFNLIVIDVPN